MAEAYRRNYAGSLDLETCVVEIGSAHAGVLGTQIASPLEDLSVDAETVGQNMTRALLSAVAQ